MQHGCLDLDEILGVEQLAHRGDDLAALDERVAGLLGDPQIDIALAVAGVGIGDAVPLVGERPTGGREHVPTVDAHAQLAPPGHHDDAGDGDPVADRQAGEALEVGGRLGHGEELDPARGILKRPEGELALIAPQHEATGDRDDRVGLGAGFEGAMGGDDLSGRMGDVVAVGVVAHRWFRLCTIRRPWRVR